MELLLIGGLASSLFQGNVIISNDRFLEQFPESSGTYNLSDKWSGGLLALILNGWFWIFTVARSALKDQTIHTALRND